MRSGTGGTHREIGVLVDALVSEIKPPCVLQSLHAHVGGAARSGNERSALLDATQRNEQELRKRVPGGQGKTG